MKVLRYLERSSIEKEEEDYGSDLKTIWVCHSIRACWTTIIFRKEF